MKITLSITLSLVAIFSMNCQPNNAKIEQQTTVSEPKGSNAGQAELNTKPANLSPAMQTAPPKNAQKPVQTAPKTTDKNPIENKVDFICGMKVTPEFTDTCVYRGKTYAFCSEYCKETFLEKPEKYLKKK